MRKTLGIFALSLLLLSYGNKGQQQEGLSSNLTEKLDLFELFKQKCGWTDQEVQNNVRVI